MTNAVVRAAHEFMNDEAKRAKRPRFTPQEQGTLQWHLDTLVRDASHEDLNIHQRRGFAAVDLIGYQGETRDEPAVNVIADILHHVEAIGLDPLTVLAHARAEYFRDKGQGPLGLPSEVSE